MRSATSSITPVLSKSGPFSDPLFEPGAEALSTLAATKVLVIGAGGLGCEVLKNLALSGFRDIHVIDMDTIDVLNLNRQFLFRPHDVGRSKAEVAAAFVQARVPGCRITPYCGRIQDKTPEYYRGFQLVVCGLDSIEARRWMNATLVLMVDPSDPELLVPMVDGGSEGFRGSVRVILPTLSACYECGLDTLGKQTTYPVCTIANTPRLPEHCVEWALVLEWPRTHTKPFDADDPEDVDWLYAAAAARALLFGIAGVTRAMALGVVKNIIPAIASTNAVIAAAVCNEAFKLATSCTRVLDNFMTYLGDYSVFSYTFHYAQKPDCPVCGVSRKVLNVPGHWTLGDLLEHLAEWPEVNMKAASVSSPDGPLYFRQPPALEESTRENLARLVSELAPDGALTATDPALPLAVKLQCVYSA